jgi:hypothetical protein
MTGVAEHSVQLQPGTNHRIRRDGDTTQLGGSPVAASASTGAGTATASDDGGTP